MNSQIIGTGSYLPEKILSNDDLEKLVETSNDWIVERTGIRKRHLAALGQGSSDLALVAAQRALDMAKISPETLDAIVFATVTPDQIMPSAACCLQAKLGCRDIMAFDLAAACSGFLYGFSIADQLLKAPNYKHILVVGSEILSSFVNYKDRTTCILFGDGAGAMVVKAVPTDESKVLGYHMAANGNFGDLLILPAGGSLLRTTEQTLKDGLHYVQMKGREIFKAAVRAMSQSCEQTLKNAGLSPSDVKWLIPHQANVRIIEAVGEHLGISSDKVILNISETGNTSSASIPLAFDGAVRDGRIRRGDIVLLTAFGGGLTYGSILFKF